MKIIIIIIIIGTEKNNMKYIVFCGDYVACLKLKLFFLPNYIILIPMGVSYMQSQLGMQVFKRLTYTGLDLT